MSRKNGYSTKNYDFESIKEILDQQLESEALQEREAVRKTELKPLTDGQSDLMNAIDECDIIGCVGPAGTGKSYLAVGKAVQFLKEKKFKKIIIVRPMVECGEKIGFLPGDLKEKTGVYMEPLFETFGDFLTNKEIFDYERSGAISVQPLAFMRGKTFKHSFVILDEAQNASYKQLKMFLTRLGEGSKILICGDIQQSDLFDYRAQQFAKVSTEDSALDYVCDLLLNIDDDKIEVIELTTDDIVRHGLVRKIIENFP